jgi:predicted nucleotidyltransferase
MNQKRDRREEIVRELYDFRSRIPANLDISKIKEVWDMDFSQDSIENVIEPRGNIIEEKTKIAEESLEWILFKPFVKFVAISGSVASEFAKEEDDIDLFIVTKNDSVWIYRLYIYIKNLFKHKIRSKGSKQVKNKLCVNFLAEQRALLFEEDIFNLNEILFLEPIYNERFEKVILLNNPWLKDHYLLSEKFLGKDRLKVGDVKEITKRNYILLPLNFIVFIAQVLFMIVMRHNPDLMRLFRGFKDGRVEFYPKDFKDDKV